MPWCQILLGLRLFLKSFWALLLLTNQGVLCQQWSMSCILVCSWAPVQSKKPESHYKWNPISIIQTTPCWFVVLWTQILCLHNSCCLVVGLDTRCLWCGMRKSIREANSQYRWWNRFFKNSHLIPHTLYAVHALPIAPWFPGVEISSPPDRPISCLPQLAELAWDVKS